MDLTGMMGRMSYLTGIFLLFQEREEMQQQEEAKRKQYEAEMARLEREAAERERARQAEERREIARKHAKERIEQLKNTTIGAKLIQNMAEEELAELDADDIMAKQVEQLEKEKKELQDRLKSQSKKVRAFPKLGTAKYACLKRIESSLLHFPTSWYQGRTVKPIIITLRTNSRWCW